MKPINITGDYTMRKTVDKHDYKGEYQKLFPSKMSSSGFLTLFILYILDKKGEPMYGKEITEAIELMLGSKVWTPSHGTLYPILDTLKKEGLIVLKMKITSKKYYIITPEGKLMLAEKLNDFKEMLVSSNTFFNKIVNKFYLNM